jgi:CubicO group peptidase (beta-lactamase class C family)
MGSNCLVMFQKILKGIAWLIFLLVLGINLFIVFSGKFYLYKTIRYNFSNIDDGKIFAKRVVQIGKPELWHISKNYNKTPLPDSLATLLGKLKTVATLVIKNDSIVFEQYWDGYSDTSHSNSFSVAKSMVSLLVGIALKEGKIKSVDDPVVQYLPEYKKNIGNKVTVRNLLTMSSGLNWDESYKNPLSMTTEAYYGWDLKAVLKKLMPEKEPGSVFYYKSGDTQLIGMLLSKVYGKTLSELMSEKIWQKIGAEHPAFWSLDDDNGVEKAYCCFNSNARDFARIGKLMLNKGVWNHDTLVPYSYIRSATLPNNLIDEETNKTVDYYGWQWWILPNHKNMNDMFYARGVNGQYVIVIPSKNIVIVRLGDKRGEKVGKTVHHKETLQLIDFALTL